MVRSRAAGIAALCLVVLASPAQSQQIVARDGRGRTVRLAGPPKRIVSTAPAVTEILFALGVGDRVVGATIFCDYPRAALRIPRIGDSRTSVEKVVALRPDLVIASGSANRIAIRALDQMRSARVATFVVDPNTFPQLYGAIRAIGAVVGRPRQAASLVARMQARVKTVRDAMAKRADRPSVLVVLQPEPLWTVGSANFVDEVVTIAGGRNIAVDSGPGYHTYPIEKALENRPQVILVSRESAAKLRANRIWRSTPAYRDARIYPFDPNTLARPGPRLVDALQQIVPLIHPDAAPRGR